MINIKQFGSRANPNKLNDNYSDYDIAYVVTETESFLYNKTFLDRCVLYAYNVEYN